MESCCLSTTRNLLKGLVKEIKWNTSLHIFFFQNALCSPKMLTSWYFKMAKTHMLQAPVCTSSRCMYFHVVPMNFCLNSTFGKLCVEWNGSQMKWSGFVCSPELFLKLYIFFWAWSQSVKGTMRSIFVRSAYIKNPKTSVWPRRIKPFDELGLAEEVFERWQAQSEDTQLFAAELD